MPTVPFEKLYSIAPQSKPTLPLPGHCFFRGGQVKGSWWLRVCLEMYQKSFLINLGPKTGQWCWKSWSISQGKRFDRTWDSTGAVCPPRKSGVICSHMHCINPGKRGWTRPNGGPSTLSWSNCQSLWWSWLRPFVTAAFGTDLTLRVKGSVLANRRPKVMFDLT